MLKVTKVLHPSKDYQLVVRRRLEDNGNTLCAHGTFIGADGKRVECENIFTRIGDSTSTPPASSFPEGQGPTELESAPKASIQDKQSEKEVNEKESVPDKADFSGVWTRFKSHNMDLYAGAMGAGYMQRKLAGSIPMQHTITMNPPDLTAFRLQESAGPVKNDTLYTINAAEAIEVNLGKKPHRDIVQWKTSITEGTLLEAMPSQGPTLVTTKTPVDGSDYTIYQGRYLEDENTLVVVRIVYGYEVITAYLSRTSLIYYNQMNIHYTHSTGQEIVASNWMKRDGPSPNPAPVPQLPIKSSNVDGLVEKSATSDEAPASGSSRQRSTTSLRVDFSGVWERQADDGEKMMSSVMQSKEVLTKAIHTITMNPPELNSFNIVEKSTKTNISVERSYEIGGDYIETTYDDKAFKEKCYWLGDALVIQKLSLANDVEIVITRFAEGDQIRLVTVRNNLNTGDKTESVAFFTRTGSDENEKVD